ncbi:Rhs element Vgr protein [Massilia endophytica]|uniref:Rhs element Vgr protein n=1 Tax=Massilia endophytica TaxID=2899220 RepID=UPI001E501669|nr:Rhs element Vgr protein [Massilia endophytica]UGQ47411.1 Rhs element Vgr protein [Massilia endophytica]
MAARPLTHGEVSLAKQLFGDAIDYARVRIHDRGYFWRFQSRHTAVAPNGQIYFNHEDFLTDFSQSGPKGIHWFMHEMVHVWQWQQGYRLRLRGACRIGLSYRYELAPGKELGDYNMEAQGDLLADYFMLRFFNAHSVLAQPQYADALPLFEQVLSGFLSQPASQRHLPGGTRGRSRIFHSKVKHRHSHRDEGAG